MYGVVTRNVPEVDWPAFDTAFYEVKDVSGRPADPIDTAVNMVSCFGDNAAASENPDLVPVDADPLARYLEKARAVGLAGDDHLFADPAGDPISPGAFETVQARARAARVNVDGQGSVCAALHESRNGTVVDD